MKTLRQHIAEYSFGRMNAHTVQSFTLLLLITFFCFTACSDSESPGGNSAVKDGADTEMNSADDHGTITLSKQQQANANIATIALTQSPFSTSLKVQGRLDVPPQYTVVITSALGGIVRQTMVLPGAHVNKGQTLLVLEHPSFVALQQDYLETKNRLELAELELQRQQVLASENVNAKRTHEQANSTVKGLKISVQAIGEKLSFLHIDAAKLTASGIKKSIRIPSPITGHVTEVKAVVGSAVSEVDVLMRLVETKHMHVELLVYERDVQSLAVGRPLTVQIVGDNHPARNGSIHLIGKQVNPDRTVLVHGHFDHADNSLLPGSTATALIQLNTVSAYAVPTTALVRIDNRTALYEQTSPTTFTLHYIETGRRNATHTELLGNVQDLNGKLIVVSGVNSLQGMVAEPTAHPH